MSSSEAAIRSRTETRTRPRVWGLDPVQIHDRYWAARGVQVVRQGERSEIVAGAELYLLTPADALVLFPLREIVETLCWLKPELLLLRLAGGRDGQYSESVRRGDDDEVLGIERRYGDRSDLPARVGITPEPEVARLWQNSSGEAAGWRLLRQQTARERREIARSRGRSWSLENDGEVMAFLNRLVVCWNRPDTTISGLRRHGRDVWIDESAEVDPATRFIGPAWVGAGRRVDGRTPVAGPAVLWDDAETDRATEGVEWQEIEPLAQDRLARRAARLPLLASVGRRLFDVGFALAAIAVTLPLYPFVILAILLEDGWPVFFVHRRQTRGGKEFPCLKFRSMRKDADRIKREIEAKNQADGPQFFIHGDPRLTRVGRFIRKTQIDELPQFFNVLIGHMSIVGPRPSPHAENQYSPAWREARLSVKPGITGLWQVKRTRKPGLDFQEWIRFDLEYVRERSMLLDLWIIGQTLLLLLQGKASR